MNAQILIKFSVRVVRGELYRHKPASEILGICLIQDNSSNGREKKKREARRNNESLQVIVCAEDKSDLTGALFKTYMILVVR